LRGIYIPDEAQDLLKSLLRQRAETTKQLRAIRSNIKALLLYHGIEVPSDFDKPNWTKAFLKWLREIKWSHTTGKICLESKLRMHDVIYQEYLQLANELRAYCRKHHKKDYDLLKSIPGVGGYLASAILAEIGDLRRFNSEAQFASYVGIVPTMRNSGGTEKIQGVTPRCRGLLRSYIIESAWVALRMDPEMPTYYRKHIGRNPKSIIVKIARKLLNRMLSIIKTGEPYQSSYSLNNGKETKTKIVTKEKRELQ
jgi:transposase